MLMGFKELSILKLPEMKQQTLIGKNLHSSLDSKPQAASESTSNKSAQPTEPLRRWMCNAQLKTLQSCKYVNMTNMKGRGAPLQQRPPGGAGCARARAPETSRPVQLLEYLMDLEDSPLQQRPAGGLDVHAHARRQQPPVCGQNMYVAVG